MSDKTRLWLLSMSGLPLAAILVWGVTGLPGFGKYPGPYGDIVAKTTVPERHITDVVTSVMFDQRGLDTLGEEFILFAAVAGVALLLREHRERQEPEAEVAHRDQTAPRRKSDAVAMFALLMAGPLFVFGTYVVAQAQITVGGGFQGGIVLSAAWLLIYLGDQRGAFHHLAPKHIVEAFEALGAASYAAVGIAGLVAGVAFLQNILPLGKPAALLSGGTVPVINLAVGVEVTAAFVLLMLEFVKEARQAEEEGKME